MNLFRVKIIYIQHVRFSSQHQFPLFVTVGAWTIGFGFGVSTMRGMLSKMCKPQEQGMMIILFTKFTEIFLCNFPPL